MAVRPATAKTNLGALLDVPLKVTVELGRTSLLVAEILTLRTGGVIELEKLEGEPLDIKVGGKLIARGVAVVVNERLAVRVTEILDTSDAALSEAG